MRKTASRKSTEDQSIQAMLDAARASKEFRNRCRDAGMLALSINRLRAANRNRAFQRIPLRKRVTALAQTAKVPLAPVLEWFGLKEMSLIDSDAALAGFGREIGFKAADLFESLKATAAEAKGLILAQATRGRKRKEIQWDGATLARFRSLKEAIDAEYTTESQSDDE